MCTVLVLGDGQGDGQGGPAHGAPTALGDFDKTGDLLADLRTYQSFMVSPSCRQELAPLPAREVKKLILGWVHGCLPRQAGTPRRRAGQAHEGY